MLIGVCGGIAAGKSSIATYLVNEHNFTRIHLTRTSPPPAVERSASSSQIPKDTSSKEEPTFPTVAALLDFVTSRWQQHWVITDIWDEKILDWLLHRPFFLLVSVDAPITLRWERFKTRCTSHNLTAPSLADFILRNDAHLYAPQHGLAPLIHRAHLHLLNTTSTLEDLYSSLSTLDLPNPSRLRPTWDQYFMQLADLAARRSNCMKRAVGCVLVRDKRVISTGYNGTPRGIKNCNDGGCKRCNGGTAGGTGLDSCLCLHAEENALLEAGRDRLRDGSILYCNTCPCLTCSVKIAQVGISEVVYSKGYSVDDMSAAVLKEAGVELRQFSPPTEGLVDLNVGNEEVELPLRAEGRNVRGGARSSTRWIPRPYLAIHGRSTAHSLPARRRLTTQTTDETEVLVPLRKQLKDEAKQKRSDIKAGIYKSQNEYDLPLENWELTVGIEIHAELNTARKLFSDAATSNNEEPNSNVSLFDLAYPGSQPIFQTATLLPALRAAIALNCEIQRKSSFDRKHYFYQDQPAGYQITQYYEPFARDGSITLYDHDGIAPEDGRKVVVGIKQVQMEQDTAKTIQDTATTSLLDFNRVSHPLIEIITLPHIHHPSTAAACVRKIQAILKSVDACTAGMEIGGLRADVNVSIRRRHETSVVEGKHQYYGVTGLGQRTEIKNLSSFKAVEDAIVAERNRQIRLLESGGVVEGETRGWTLGSTETRRLRGKEGEVDYRYMPDPDIHPIIISDDLVSHLRATLPALPDSILTTLTTGPTHGLTMKDAKTLLSSEDGDRLEYYFDVHAQLQAKPGLDQPKQLGRVVGNWVIHELGGLFSKAETPWSAQQVSSSSLAAIISKVLQKKVSHDSGKKIMAMIFAGDERRVSIIAKENKMIMQDISEDIYTQTAETLVRDNPEMAKAIKEKGQTGKMMWFVGQMMKRITQQTGQGGVKPELAKKAIAKALDKPASGEPNSDILGDLYI
ncbi:hypothetical protein FKW77_009020 [Venturia effusa]|uniref:Glutamyl-tRNA(Gln) amidotransferase subunit B, mitochondrial n=1 Tax=Venturia effusa TaxID=50376 RepID=A0A517L808_9PEZI|nr:hypothetical protein FKW77_009020 [Venturia effusa]